MAWLLHNWHGYLLIRLSGFSPERFLNLCSANRIEIWGIHHRNGAYEYYMTVPGYRNVKSLARKAKVRLNIIDKLGLPFFLHKNRKRKLFFTGFFSFFLLLYLMSLFIWDISLEGNYLYTEDTLLTYFESQDIRHGMWKKTISCEEIEAGIRNYFPEITWVSARVSGTRLLVNIKENEVISSIPVKDEVPCDLVASTAGIITKMVVRQGVAQVRVGDEVEAGQLLVSSGVPITNDGEEVVKTNYVHADADIYAKTTHEYTKKLPSLHTVQVKTGKKKTGYYLKILNYHMLVMLPGKEDQMWSLAMEEQQLKLFHNFYLPVYYGKIKGEEYMTYERFYTKEEKKQIGKRLQNQFLEKLIEKGVHIIENNVKILGNEFVCTIQGSAVGEELIGMQAQITEPEEKIEPDERSGENH